MPPSPTGSSPPARPSRDALSALNQSFFRSLCRPPLPRSARVLTRGGEEDGKDGYRAGRTPDGLAEPSPTIRGVLPGSGRRPWPFTAVHRYVIAAEAGGCKVTYTEDLTRLEGAPLACPGSCFRVSAKYLRRGFDGVLTLGRGTGRNLALDRRERKAVRRSPMTPSSSRPLGR
jgi:hypothetical protein